MGKKEEKKKGKSTLTFHLHEDKIVREWADEYKKVDLREINPNIPPCWVPYCLSNFPSRELISLLLQHLAEKRAYSSICLNWNIIGLGRRLKMPSTILKSFFPLSWLSSILARGCVIWPFVISASVHAHVQCYK